MNQDRGWVSLGETVSENGYLSRMRRLAAESLSNFENRRKILKRVALKGKKMAA